MELQHQFVSFLLKKENKTLIGNMIKKVWLCEMLKRKRYLKSW